MPAPDSNTANLHTSSLTSPPAAPDPHQNLAPSHASQASVQPPSAAFHRPSAPEASRFGSGKMSAGSGLPSGSQQQQQAQPPPWSSGSGRGSSFSDSPFVASPRTPLRPSAPGYPSSPTSDKGSPDAPFFPSTSPPSRPPLLNSHNNQSLHHWGPNRRAAQDQEHSLGVIQRAGSQSEAGDMSGGSHTRVGVSWSGGPAQASGAGAVSQGFTLVTMTLHLTGCFPIMFLLGSHFVSAVRPGTIFREYSGWLDHGLSHVPHLFTGRPTIDLRATVHPWPTLPQHPPCSLRWVEQIRDAA
jgi:hypothetical protein